MTALLAMSLNLVVGHGGLFQFHHAAFYGVGAYTAGLILAKTSWPWWIAFLAGIAGVLFVIVEGSVFPDLLFWVLSLEVFIMCLLGGWFTFGGPILGAAFIVSLRTFVGIYTEYRTLILGVILILLIFLLPEGLLGYNFLGAIRSWSKRNARRNAE